MPTEPPHRGEVWIVQFDPSIDGEIQRTAVIVSNDTANALLTRVQVEPISSRVGTLYPAEVMVTLNGAPRKAMADQITTVSKPRLVRLTGRLTPRDMTAVDRAIMLQLAL